MKNPRTLADLKADPRVADVYPEPGNGWWVYLSMDWYSPYMECRTIREDSLREVCRKVAMAEKVTPDVCRELRLDPPEHWQH